MHTLRKQDRDASMTSLVSFHGVPMRRGIAFAIDHIESHSAHVAIFSANRTVGAIAEHNRQFGTHLSAQQALIDAHARDPRLPAANPISQTSHCGYADPTIAALLTLYGHAARSGRKIPWWAEGTDLADIVGGEIQIEDVHRFLAKAHELGYDFCQPYPNSGNEKHHVILVNSPIPRLEAWNVISKNRSAA